MPIQLNIVGIFFGAPLQLTGQQKVIDVLAFAKSEAPKGNLPNVSEFNYEVSNPPRVAALSFYAKYEEGFAGRGVGIHYPAGQYFLSENLMGTPSYTVWQYYVQNADGTPVVGGVKFLDDPNATVPADGILTWRLVSILKGVNPPPLMAAVRQA